MEPSLTLEAQALINFAINLGLFVYLSISWLERRMKSWYLPFSLVTYTGTTVFSNLIHLFDRNTDLYVIIELFIDVDDFKQVNDRYGHAVGDRVLNGISDVLEKSIRKADIVGRWGGNEFLLLLRDDTDTSIGRVVNKIRVIVDQQTCQADHDSFYVICSFAGVIPSETELIR